MRSFHGIPTNIYVEVIARIDKLGMPHPMKILWQDGREFTIDKVIRAVKCRLASGDEAKCYECEIGGKKRDLYLQDGKWFVIVDKPLK